LGYKVKTANGGAYYPTLGVDVAGRFLANTYTTGTTDSISMESFNPPFVALSKIEYKWNDDDTLPRSFSILNSGPLDYFANLSGNAIESAIRPGSADDAIPDPTADNRKEYQVWDVASSSFPQEFSRNHTIFQQQLGHGTPSRGPSVHQRSTSARFALNF
jgi:hypothetical protein